jgi:hypothetical protein
MNILPYDRRPETAALPARHRVLPGQPGERQPAAGRTASAAVAHGDLRNAAFVHQGEPCIPACPGIVPTVSGGFQTSGEPISTSQPMSRHLPSSRDFCVAVAVIAAVEQAALILFTTSWTGASCQHHDRPSGRRRPNASSAAAST